MSSVFFQISDVLSQSVAHIQTVHRFWHLALVFSHRRSVDLCWRGHNRTVRKKWLEWKHCVFWKVPLLKKNPSSAFHSFWQRNTKISARQHMHTTTMLLVFVAPSPRFIFHSTFQVQNQPTEPLEGGRGGGAAAVRWWWAASRRAPSQSLAVWLNSLHLLPFVSCPKCTFTIYSLMINLFVNNVSKIMKCKFVNFLVNVTKQSWIYICWRSACCNC